MHMSREYTCMCTCVRMCTDCSGEAKFVLEDRFFCQPQKSWQLHSGGSLLNYGGSLLN